MPEDTTDPGSITFKVLYDQGKDIHTCVKSNTKEIGVVKKKITDHLLVHDVKNGVKRDAWTRTMQIVKIAAGIITIIGALWMAGNFFRPDMKELANELARHNPAMDYVGAAEEDP